MTLHATAKGQSLDAVGKKADAIARAFYEHECYEISMGKHELESATEIASLRDPLTYRTEYVFAADFMAAERHQPVKLAEGKHKCKTCGEPLSAHYPKWDFPKPSF